MNLQGAELLDPIRPEDYALRIRMAAYDELPPALRSHFDPRGPLYLLVEPISIRFRRWIFRLQPGFFTDASSIPLWLRPIGVSRWTAHLELVPASLIHDAWWRGLVPREIRRDDPRFSPAVGHALLGNDAYREIAQAGGYRGWRACGQAAVLGAVARLKFGLCRAKFATEPNPDVLRVTELTA